MKALEVNGVSKRFPGMEKPALNRVGFTLEQGECLGIVGGSGSGKSTLAKWLHGFFATHAKPYPYKVGTLHNLCGSTDKSLRIDAHMIAKATVLCC